MSSMPLSKVLLLSLERNQHLHICSPDEGLQTVLNPSLSLLISGMNKLSDSSHSSFILPSKPFTTYLALLWTLIVLYLFYIAVPKTAFNVSLYQNRAEWDIPFSQQASNIISDVPQSTAGPFGYQRALLTHIQFAIKQKPLRSLSSGLLSSLSSLRLNKYPGLLHLRYRIQHLLLFSFMWLMIAQPSNLLRSVCKNLYPQWSQQLLPV